MLKPVVSLVQYKDVTSVSDAIQFFDGFENIKAGDRLVPFIIPNEQLKEGLGILESAIGRANKSL